MNLTINTSSSTLQYLSRKANWVDKLNYIMHRCYFILSLTKYENYDNMSNCNTISTAIGIVEILHKER